MAQTTAAIKLQASISGAEQVKKLKEEIKEAAKEAEKIAKEFGKDSEEAKKAAEAVEKLKSGLGGFKTIKQQIKEATQEAILLARKFGEFSPEATAAAQKVAQLKDQMDDLNDKIQALHPDKFNRINTIAQGVANGFQAAQGAMALFGAESEDVQKALLKVQGAMALAQGLEGLDAAGKQLKTLGQAAVGAFNSMTTASKAFMATGLGLIISGIAYAIANFDELAKSLGFAESEMDKMNKAMNIAAAETKTQAADLNFYNSVVQDTTKSEGEREFALQKLKEAGIATDDINVANANSLGKLNDRVKQQILLIAQRARAEAAAQILQEKTKKLIEMQNGDLDDATTMWDTFYAGAKGALLGVTAGAEEYKKRGLDNIKEAQKDVTDATKVHQKELEKTTKLEGVAVTTSKAVTSTLKNQKQATKDLAQEELQRRATMLALDQTTIDKAIAAADAAFAVKVKQLKDQGFTELQIGAIRDAELEKVRTDFYNKEKAEREKAQKEREQQVKETQEKEIADAQKFTEDYFKAQQTAYAQRGATQAEFDALEMERLNAQLQTARDYGQSTVDLELQIAQKKKDIYDKDVEAKKNAEEQKIALTRGGFQAIGELVTAFAGSSEEAQRTAFEINKAASIAMAIIDTYVAAQGAYKSQMAIATPDAPVRASIAAGIAIAQGLARVATIKKTQFQTKSAGGGGGGGGTPPAPSMTPTEGGALPDEQQFGGMGRVYVLEGDITKTQTRVRRLRNTSVV